MSRIPDRQADREGCQRYWRDRRYALDELPKLRDDVKLVCDDTPDAKRRGKYSQAQQLLVRAQKLFEEGWRL